MKTYTDKAVKFLLKDIKADRPTLIYLVFRYDNKRFVTSTGQTITPFLWDATGQRVVTDAKIIKNKRERETHETINAQLDRQRSAFIKVLNQLSLARIPLDNDTIKQYFDAETGREKKDKQQPAKLETFTEFIERFVEQAKVGQRLNAQSVQYSAFTLKGYQKLKRILEQYQTDTRRGINYDDFSLDFYQHFKLWLTKRGLSLNYVGCLLKDLKILLKLAHADGLHTNTIFQHRDFKKLSEEVDNIYLSDSELNALFALDLSTHTRLERVRDLFLIGAYTGLRFSDFSELRPENITHNGRILTRKTSKTSERVSIPLNANVLSILAKYAGIPPRAITNQRLNDYLKELGKLAGFVERIEVTRTRGGTKKKEYLEKWELMTTHTARRSFATNAFLAGIPTPSIMKITGHKTETQFLKYIKVTGEQNALLLLNHPHFGGNPAEVQSLKKVA